MRALYTGGRRFQRAPRCSSPKRDSRIGVLCTRQTPPVWWHPFSSAYRLTRRWNRVSVHQELFRRGFWPSVHSILSAFWIAIRTARATPEPWRGSAEPSLPGFHPTDIGSRSRGATAPLRCSHHQPSGRFQVQELWAPYRQKTEMRYAAPRRPLLVRPCLETGRAPRSGTRGNHLLRFGGLCPLQEARTLRLWECRC